MTMVSTAGLMALAFGLALALGGFLASYLVTDTGLDLVRRAYRRSGPRRWRRVVQALRPKSAAAASERRRGNWRAVLPLAPAVASVALAWYLLPRSGILAVYVAAAGGAMAYYLARRRRVQQASSVVSDLARLIAVFQSRYRLYQTVIPALEAAAEKVDDPLRGWVTQAVQAVHGGQGAAVGLDRLELLGSGDAYLAQFVAIARRVPLAHPDTVDEVLDDLARRLREREHLLAEQRITLTTVTITARVLQGVGLVAVGIALILLGDFYFASSSRQGVFMVVTATMLGTAIYFDQRVLSLRERVL